MRYRKFASSFRPLRRWNWRVAESNSRMAMFRQLVHEMGVGLTPHSERPEDSDSSNEVARQAKGSGRVNVCHRHIFA